MRMPAEQIFILGAYFGAFVTIVVGLILRAVAVGQAERLRRGDETTLCNDAEVLE